MRVKGRRYKGDTDAERFLEFHKANPDVYRRLLRMVDDVKAAGFDKYSIMAFIHRIRWHYDIDVKFEDFKINDHFGAYYARKIMKEYPEHKGFFELRRMGECPHEVENG